MCIQDPLGPNWHKQKFSGAWSPNFFLIGILARIWNPTTTPSGVLVTTGPRWRGARFYWREAPLYWQGARLYWCVSWLYWWGVRLYRWRSWLYSIMFIMKIVAYLSCSAGCKHFTWTNRKWKTEKGLQNFRSHKWGSSLPCLHMRDTPARPPINMSRNFSRTFLQNKLQTPPPTHKNSYLMFWAPLTAHFPLCLPKIGLFGGGRGGRGFSRNYFLHWNPNIFAI